MKSRKQVPVRFRYQLLQEVDLVCPFCASKEVDTFEVHHLDGMPDNNDLNNLLMVCPTCHAKITSGTISINETYIKKYELSKKGRNLSVPASTPPAISLSNISGTTIIGNNNTIITKDRKLAPAIPSEGAIGNSAKERSYTKHLYDRLIDFKARALNCSSQQAGIRVAQKYNKLFGATWTHTPIERFDDVAAYLQKEIESTPIGKYNKKRGIQNFSSYDEFLTKNF